MGDFEFLSNNLHISFPFRTPAPMLATGGDPVDAGQLFADARFFTSVMTPVQLRLHSLDVDTTVNPPTTGTVVLHDQDDVEFITLTELNSVFRVDEYGSWMVLEWKQKLTGGGGLSGDRHVVRLLLSKDKLATLPVPLSVTTPAGEGYFEDALIKQGPPRVTRFFLKIGTLLFPVLGDKLVLEKGFNIEIKEKEATDEDAFTATDFVASDVRTKRTLFIDAVPGAGRGRFLKCSDPVIRTINGVGPNDRGNVNLRPNDCYWYELPLLTLPVDVNGQEVTQVASVEPHTIQLHNACVECCSCDAYAAAYRNLAALWSRAQAIATRINAIRTSYGAIVDLIQGTDASVKILAISRAGFVFDVSILVTPGASGFPEGSELQIKFTASVTPSNLDTDFIPDTGLLSTNELADQPVDPAGVGPTYTIDIPSEGLGTNGFINWTGSFRAPSTRISPTDGVRTGGSVTIKAELLVDAAPTAEDATTIKLKPPESLN